MNKYFGQLGFAETQEVPANSGIWKEVIVEYDYYGDILRNSRNRGSSDKVNEDVEISNQISIVSDAYATEHLYNIRYITWLGNKWKVSSIDVEYPRLILSIGGLYNAKSTYATGET